VKVIEIVISRYSTYDFL